MSSFAVKPLAVVAALSAAALVACGDDGSDGSGAGAGAPSGSASSGSASGGAGPGSGGGDASSSSGFGVGGGGTGGSSAEGCTKVDFLFVIDNSVSMNDEQAALVQSFPGFIDTIQNTVAASSDYHIMVVDTDAWGRCNTANPWTGISPNHATCNDYIRNTVFEECDRVLGAGVIHPAGAEASNQLCEVYGGNRYIIEGEPNLGDTFGCMALVGTAGHSAERPMDAMVAAVAPGINASGGCNAGFLRDDAILVITFISDDPNYEDAGTPQDWYDAVVAAKNGNPDAVVVLGLTPYVQGGPSTAAQPRGAHWHQFIEMWGSKGLEASVTLADYSPFFAQAVGLIEEACEEFVEPPK